jgi:hypothetical protein
MQCFVANPECLKYVAPDCYGESGSGFESVIDPASYFTEFDDTNFPGIRGVPQYFADLQTCVDTLYLETNPCSACDERYATAFSTRYSSPAECAENQCNKCSNCEERFATHFTTRYANSTLCEMDHCEKWTCAYCDINLEGWLDHFESMEGDAAAYWRYDISNNTLQYHLTVDSLRRPIFNEGFGSGPNRQKAFDFANSEDEDKWYTQAQCKSMVCNNCTHCIESFQSAFKTEYPDQETCRAHECPKVCSRCKYEWESMINPNTNAVFGDLDECMIENCEIIMASSCDMKNGGSGTFLRRYTLIDVDTDSTAGTA